MSFHTFLFVFFSIYFYNTRISSWLSRIVVNFVFCFIVVRPNSSPFKKPPISSSSTLTSTPPSRINTVNPPPHTVEEVQRLQPSHSTEELNQEMANLEGLMLTLSTITANQFECWMKNEVNWAAFIYYSHSIWKWRLKLLLTKVFRLRWDELVNELILNYE